jgi:Ca2+-binding RTX toxin-like protein
MGAARWLSCSGVSALLAVLATLLLVQPANAQEEDPCATAPLGAIVGTAGSGDDFIIGGFGTDTLDGGTGNDLLFGGQNSDLINGGPGDDLLVGDIPTWHPRMGCRPPSTHAPLRHLHRRQRDRPGPHLRAHRRHLAAGCRRSLGPGHQTWRPGPPEVAARTGPQVVVSPASGGRGGHRGRRPRGAFFPGAAPGPGWRWPAPSMADGQQGGARLSST